MSANEIEAEVIEVNIAEKEWIETDQIICALETAKAVLEVVSDVSGYIYDLRVEEGDRVRVGDQICLIVDSLDEDKLKQLPVLSSDDAVSDHTTEKIPENLRITKAALELAQSFQLDINKLPMDRIVSKSMIQDLADGGVEKKKSASGRELVLFGGGGHAKMLIDLFRQQTFFNLIGIIDDAIQLGKTVMGIRVLGDRKCLNSLLNQGIIMIANGLGTNDLKTRIEISEHLRSIGFIFPAIIHHRAIVEPSVQFEDGVQVLAGAYIGTETVIKQDCVINTGAIVSHHCQIDSNSTISPGALLASKVKIGKKCLIGMGVKINAGVKIGDECRIGNGAIIHFDVKEGSTVRTLSDGEPTHYASKNSGGK